MKNIKIQKTPEKKLSPRTVRLILIAAIILPITVTSIIISCSHIPMTVQIAVGNIDSIQVQIDDLEKKAIDGESFTIEEQDFCIKLFESLAFGGKVMGYSEASDMLSHYIHGNGASIQMGNEAYTENSTVNDECRTLLLRIEKDIRAQKWHEKRKYASPTIFIKQDDDSRLFFLSNVFEILACAEKIGNKLYRVEFVVNRYYEFSSYTAQMERFNTPKHLVTFFPTSIPGKTLTIDDGLSHYLSKTGIAKEFDYFAQWEDELRIF